MKIEEEIKQGKFESEFQKATLNILVTASWLGSQVNAILKNFGISQAQFNVLRILRGQKNQPCALGTITERMVDKMITPKGLELLEKIDPLVKDMFGRINNVDPDDLAKLNAVLDKLRSQV